MAAYSEPVSLDDDEVATIYESTNGGRRIVKTKRADNETVAQFKARHDEDVLDEMSSFPPKFAS